MDLGCPSHYKSRNNNSLGKRQHHYEIPLKGFVIGLDLHSKSREDRDMLLTCEVRTLFHVNFDPSLHRHVMRRMILDDNFFFQKIVGATSNLEIKICSDLVLLNEPINSRFVPWICLSLYIK